MGPICFPEALSPCEVESGAGGSSLWSEVGTRTYSPPHPGCRGSYCSLHPSLLQSPPSLAHSPDILQPFFLNPAGVLPQATLNFPFLWGWSLDPPRADMSYPPSPPPCGQQLSPVRTTAQKHRSNLCLNLLVGTQPHMALNMQGCPTHLGPHLRQLVRMGETRRDSCVLALGIWRGGDSCTARSGRNRCRNSPCRVQTSELEPRLHFKCDLTPVVFSSQFFFF